MQKRKFRFIFIFLLLCTVFLGFFINTDLIKAHVDTASHIEYLSFLYNQFSENNGEMNNVSEISIDLSSTNWNLTQLEVNFTNILLDEELVPIEENPTDFYTIQKFQPLLAVQINITEPTIIYSVDIYADVIEPSINPIYIQINGYDIPTQKPNDTVIYDPVELNISSSPGWYRQTFNNASTLNPGYYALIFNGAGIINAPQPLYRWYNNIENATYPDLKIWTNNGVSWSTGIENQTFLHKYIQKTSKVINPEDLDMQLELNGDAYAISNGVSPGTGNITINNINFSPQDTIINIPISTNKTVTLMFNCSYYIKIKSRKHSIGFVTIDIDIDNIWNYTFTMNKFLLNNSIKLYYPSNWQNIFVFQDNSNITSSISFNYGENSVSISEDVLIDGATISITATTIHYEFELDVRTTEFSLQQELKFSLIEPPQSGNYTLIIYDALGYHISDSIQTISIPTDTNLFSYYIPAGAIEGEYHAYVYFFDGFNAGIEIAHFNIRIPIIITLSIILISSAIGITAVASSYVIIRKYKKKNEARKKAIQEKFNDILNLSHVMVSERKSSLNVYEQTFTAKTVDTTLISGFLSAIRSFGIELTNVEDATQTIKLEYKNSKILMSEFKDFRIVLILNDTPSPQFLESINKLSYDIETKYGKLLENFKGNVQPFTGIEDLLKIHLNTLFLYPLKIVKTGKVTINQLEKSLIVKAQNIMKNRNSSYFYITYLMDDKSWEPKDIEVLFSLLEKKVFQSVI
jgi:hypothetical protein